jgi:hypothetical protein
MSLNNPRAAMTTTPMMTDVMMRRRNVCPTEAPLATAKNIIEDGVAQWYWYNVITVR